MATLPADTVAAFGMGFEDGWLTQLVEQFAGAAGEDMTADELFQELSDQTGLDLPADVETLAGESAVLALGPDFDADELMSSADGSDVPVGVKVKGDPAAIESVLDKLRGQLGGEELTFMDTDADGDVIAIGPNADYRSELLADGGLGDSETFQDVIREAEQAGVIFYLDFDASDDWLVELAGDDPDAAKNLAPLSAVGMSAWQEDGVSHGVLRVTTDDDERASRPPDGGADGAGQPGQVLRRDLQVETAAPRGHVDRGVLPGGVVEHRAMGAALAEGGDATRDVAGGPLRGGHLGHHRAAGPERPGERLEVELPGHRHDPDGQRAVDTHHQGLEHPRRVEPERGRRLLAVRRRPRVVVIGMQREGDAGALEGDRRRGAAGALAGHGRLVGGPAGARDLGRRQRRDRVHRLQLRAEQVGDHREA